MANPERAYNPEFFEAMNTITALTVACWLEKVDREGSTMLDLRDEASAHLFFDQIFQEPSPFLIEPTQVLIHTQFVFFMKLLHEHPNTPLECLASELLNNFYIKTLAEVHSKMPDTPHPMSTTTGGFGSGLDTLVVTDILSRLYLEKHFPGFKAVSTIAQLELNAFSRFGVLQVGVIDEHYREKFGRTDRTFEALDLIGTDAVNGLNAAKLEEWKYAPALDHAGCVGLYPPPKSFRESVVGEYPNIPTKSAISQLRGYVVPTVTNLISWAKKKGGTAALIGNISPVDLGLLNGTHPNLPPHPETGKPPTSLIDEP